MKVYFAGSIRGGRRDAALYGQIIELLRQHAIVLTEHVGEADPDHDDDRLSDEAIFERDTGWLEEAHVLVAELTVPSHGVGYEIAQAERLGRPILCLYRPAAGGRPSALIAGNPEVQCRPYDRLEQIDDILETFFQEQTRRASGEA
ncbi:MAG: nucleoside 2-deoxyribosyltransferase [Anaerolineae bacterium]|jgi:hypothetical protein